MRLRIPWSSAAPAGRDAAGRPSSVRPSGKDARRDAPGPLVLPWRGQAARGGQAGGKPGRILAAKLRRTRGRVFPLRHAAIYGAIVVAAGLGIAAWDRAYESQFRAPSPNVLAKGLVENFIGPGTVHSVAVDERAHTVDMTVEDVLIKPGQSKADERQNLTREGALTISVLQSRLKDLKKITIHIVKDNKPLATATVEGSQSSPAVVFAPDLR